MTQVVEACLACVGPELNPPVIKRKGGREGREEEGEREKERER
jgi:hypothetical protein